MDQVLVQVPQQIVNGITLGCVYALLALGYSMVYGVLKMLNFAHGDVFMVGAFAGWGVFSLLTRGGSPVVNATFILAAMVLGATAATALLGAVIERLAYRPLRKGSRLAPLISALGVSIILQNMAMLMTSGRAKAIQTELLIPAGAGVHLGGASISVARLLIVGTSVGIMLALDSVVRRTRLGREMRATSQDLEAAEYVGIRTSRVIVSTFIIGSGLAGVAGVMIGLYYMQVDFTLGFSAGIKAFTAAVLGGIGNMRGAMAGGLLLGLTESLGVIVAAPVYKDAIVFTALVAALILRPAGLLGTQVRDRV
ncbi:MAG: branched-chain amino acid ABC transporter permease [Firmicutes bacterium]|jgi:branched-chain amino acid transport system permease protein|nr:branched-chain amino acid ABC transporter permease [Bacillota bacterium]